MIDAIVPIWKPVDWTSFDVVKKIRSQVRPAKVGHAGTLDPFAEGILVLCIGKKTSQVESMMNLKKEYLATVRLGSTTDTLDPTGVTTGKADIPQISQELLEEVALGFIGTIDQVPPMYSALKKDGVPLYKLARRGVTVEREPRHVRIDSIDIIGMDAVSFQLRVTCGRGTYIRSLASDMAEAMGTVGYLTELVRTRVGNFDRSTAITIEKFPEWLSTAA